MLSFIFHQLYSFSLFVLLQIPRNIPRPANNEAVAPDSVLDYVLIIGTPIILLAIYFYWKKYKKEKQA